MTKAKKPRPKKVNKSSWSGDGPLTVTFEVAAGALQHMWLRFHRPGFEGLVFTNLAAVEGLHAQLGAAITAAKAEIAGCARDWAAELVEDADPHPNESQ
jgi:NAD(P)-dependent dehydrogenase (short-subunit alcohol dehydrogenase family)